MLLLIAFVVVSLLCSGVGSVTRSQLHGLRFAGKGGLEEGVEGADDLEVLGRLVLGSEPPLIQPSELRMSDSSGGECSTPS